jgi:periplasmic protein TonB
MYGYEQPSLFSGKRGAALIAVILLHIVIVWGFYTGLAGQLVQKIIPPVEIAQIDKPKEIDKPPPPPPKLEEIKPYVPPPEFVNIQAAPPEQTTAITGITREQAPTPVAAVAAPVEHTVIGAKMDPKHPFNIGDEYYPDASKRANEQGRCIVLAHVAANGNILEAEIQTSSGFPRLDDACLKGVKGKKALPGMEDGKPVEGKFAFAIVWRLAK